MFKGKTGHHTGSSIGAYGNHIRDSEYDHRSFLSEMTPVSFHGGGQFGARPGDSIEDMMTGEATPYSAARDRRNERAREYTASYRM